jgi:hypothetical protein
MEILIQKFCACCADEQLKLFENYLLNKKYNLPQSLVQAIRKNPKESIDFYCNKIYGNKNKDSIKKMNQLSSHTLKLFSFISKNFPTFLWQNFTRIEWFIINDKNKEAKELINLVYDVALKIEDYHSIIQLVHIVKQHYASNRQLLQFNNDQLIKCTTYLKQFEDINTLHYEIIKECIQAKYVIKKNDLDFFKNHFTSKSKSIQIIAKQSYLSVLSSANDKAFFSNHNKKIIDSTIREIENNSYLFIAQYKEKLMSLDYMQVKQNYLVLNEVDINKTCSRIISKWDNIYADETVLDKGFTLALSIKGSFYITNYYLTKTSEKLQSEIDKIVTLCQNLLIKINWEKEGYLRYINFCNIFSIYLILANQEASAIKILEKALHEYQQKSFKKTYDEIFVILIMAYYQASDFDNVIDSYQRYKKLTKSKVSIIENDLIIKSIYYITQIKDNNRNQYHVKLQSVTREFENDPKMKGNTQLLKRIQKTL